MESSRRGFFGILAGLVLGPKLIGPKQLTAPTPEAWAAVRQFRPRFPEESYIPLEAFVTQTLEVLARELKWLRLQSVCPSWPRDVRIGYTAFVREPVRFYPCHPDFLTWPPPPIRETQRAVSIIHRASTPLDLRDLDFDRPWDKISTHLVEPAAYKLAEDVIGAVRRNGGAEYLVAVPGPELQDALRCVTARNEDLGLGLRAVEVPAGDGRWYPSRPRRDADPRRPILHLDMNFGLG